MKIYEIDKKYLDLLRTVDNKVANTDGKDYVFSKKYVGVILNLNNVEYFAPLSSTKTNKDYTEDGKIKPSIIPIIRLIGKNNKTNKEYLLGKIQLSNMIPIADKSIVSIYNLKNEKDLKYKNMVKKQIEIINKNIDLIKTNAEILYIEKSKNLNKGYVQNTVDFKSLEKKAIEYALLLKEKEKENKIAFDPLTGNKLIVRKGYKIPEKEVNQWITKNSVEKNNLKVIDGSTTTIPILIKKDGKLFSKNIEFYNVEQLEVSKEFKKQHFKDLKIEPKKEKSISKSKEKSKSKSKGIEI